MATSGPNYPGTAATDSTLGTRDWQNPDYCKVTDGNVAYASSRTNQTDISYYLKGTNFGFSLPTNAVVSGIEVTVRRMWETGGDASDRSLKIIKADGSLGTFDKGSSTHWPASLTDKTYGNTSDLWEESWTASDINSSNFGVALSVYLNALGTASVSYGMVDSFAITVTYVLGGPNNIKTYNGLAPASMKVITKVAKASVKSWNGLT